MLAGLAGVGETAGAVGGETISPSIGALFSLSGPSLGAALELQPHPQLAPPRHGASTTGPQ